MFRCGCIRPRAPRLGGDHERRCVKNSRYCSHVCVNNMFPHPPRHQHPLETRIQMNAGVSVPPAEPTRRLDRSFSIPDTLRCKRRGDGGQTCALLWRGPVAEMHVISEGRGARAPGSGLKDREQRPRLGTPRRSRMHRREAAPAPDRGDPSGRLFCLFCETKRVKIITSAALFGFALKPFVCSEVRPRKTASAAGTG